MHTVTKIFTQHPAQVGESYFGHLRAAIGFSGWLCVAGIAALVHALIPVLFERTASNIILRLHAKMMARR